MTSETASSRDQGRLRRRPTAEAARYFDAVELALTAALVAMLVALSALLWVGVAGIVILWLLRWRLHGRLLRPAPANWLVLPFLALLPLTLWVSLTPDASRTQVAYLFAGVAVYVVIVNWTLGEMRLWWLLASLLTVLVLAALASPFLVEQSGTPVFPWLPAAVVAVARKFPERINPNVLSGTTATLLPVCLALIVRPLGNEPRRRWVLRVLGLAAAALILGLVFVMQARGVWLALAAVAVVGVCVRWPKVLQTLPLWVAAGWVVFAQGWFQRLAFVTLGDGALGGFSSREEIWTRAAQAVMDFPLTGMGMGAWERVGPLLYPYTNIGFATTVPHAHNLFLQVGVDLGLPGLVLFLAMLGINLWMGWHAYSAHRRRNNPALAALSLAVFLGLLLAITHGMVDAVTWGTKPAILTWTLYGLGAVLFLGAEEAAATA